MKIFLEDLVVTVQIEEIKCRIINTRSEHDQNCRYKSAKDVRYSLGWIFRNGSQESAISLTTAYCIRHSANTPSLNL